MTVILVLLTIAGFVALDVLVFERRRMRIASSARARHGSVPRGSAARSAAVSPDDSYLHPGHTWVRLGSDGLALSGADEFAPSFLGRAAEVRLPAPGARLRQGEPAWTLVSLRGRVLQMPAPVEGMVVGVNEALRRDPALAQRSPYGDGWAIRLRPSRLREDLANLMPSALARAWLDGIKSAVTTRLTPDAGAVATDGGELDAAFGDRLGDASWEALHVNLFPAGRGADEPGNGPTWARSGVDPTEWR
jgi:glycine cleavage system H lipoate-binding protein